MKENNIGSVISVNNVISPRELILKYISYLPWLVISIALFIFLAFVKIRYSTPLYNVNAKLLVKSDNPYGDGNDKFQDIFLTPNSNQNLNDEIQIIKSRSMAERVINALGLQLMIYNKGSIRNSIIRNDDAPFRFHLLSISDSADLRFNLSIILKNQDTFQIGESPVYYHYGDTIIWGKLKFQLFQSRNDLHAFASNEFNLSIDN